MIRKLIGTAEVENGRAEYDWQIGEGTLPGKRKIYVEYVENDGYMLAQAWEDAYIRVPTRINFDNSNDIYVNPTTDPEHPETVTLSAIVESTLDLEPVEQGFVQFKVKTESDDTYLPLVDENENDVLVEVENGVAELIYEIPEDVGSFILVKAEYFANVYDEEHIRWLYGGCETEEPKVIRIRGSVVIDNSPVPAPQPLYDENDNRIDGTGTVEIPIYVTDSNGYVIPEGTVTFSCTLGNEEITEIIDLSDIINPVITIPDGTAGGTEIPFTLTFNGTDSYPSTTVTSSIVVKYKTIIDMEVIDGTIGNTVTLVAHVHDERGEDYPVDGGTVVFELDDAQDGENFGGAEEPNENVGSDESDDSNESDEPNDDGPSGVFEDEMQEEEGD